LAITFAVKVTLDVPSIETLPSKSPANVIVLAVVQPADVPVVFAFAAPIGLNVVPSFVNSHLSLDSFQRI